ncbi:transposase, partial [Streptococcus suis]|uniref:transposase n=1 Tax=Streptococcus suis TaxID=1307 RepID=UPI00209B9F70
MLDQIKAHLLDSINEIVSIANQFVLHPEKLKDLYAYRWGIETSFRDLKYSIGLTHFHAKKKEGILQEIY